MKNGKLRVTEIWLGGNAMRLCTECFWDDWDRIVDIYPERTDIIPEYINDPDNYKIIILESGILHGKCGDEEGDIKAPALILLTQKDQVEVKIMQKAKMNIIFKALNSKPVIASLFT